MTHELYKLLKVNEWKYNWQYRIAMILKLLQARFGRLSSLYTVYHILYMAYTVYGITTNEHPFIFKLYLLKCYFNMTKA